MNFNSLIYSTDTYTIWALSLVLTNLTRAQPKTDGETHSGKLTGGLEAFDVSGGLQEIAT